MLSVLNVLDHLLIPFLFSLAVALTLLFLVTFKKLVCSGPFVRDIIIDVV